MKTLKIYIFLLLLLISNGLALAQNCSINAGANTTICGTTYTLSGSSSGSSSGSPTWSLVSKPAGAPDPVISNVNSYTPNVTGLTFPGNYVFSISQPCTTGTAKSQVTITAPGDFSTFTAGPDITNISALTGNVTLNGVVPPGYTASWSAYNIYRWERSGTKTDENSQFSSTTSATTTFSLIKKANHDIDPAYAVTLRITAINNPNCWYEDTAIVRFNPNPQILPELLTSTCVPVEGWYYVVLQSNSPVFSKDYSGSPSSSGNYGTSVTMNVISQPAGANISFDSMWDERIFLNGLTQVGTYKFTLTLTNSVGTYTTPEITYTYLGKEPSQVSFLDPAYPHQMAEYSSVNTGGAVYCDKAGNADPITFYFKINPSDPPTITTTVYNTGKIPPGGAPSLSAVSGSNTMNRSVTVTPPAGGWRIGTYAIDVIADNGSCNTNHTYYIHISDGKRPAVSVPNTTVCYPGSGIVTATVPLPAIYKEIVNPSYFQDFDGRYDFTLISKPAGAADPTYEATNLRTFTNTSTVISNMNMQGEYVFKIKAVPNSGGVDADFIEKEYACSATSTESNFSIFVSTQVNANAGSDQSITGTSVILNGNNPGMASSGQWTLISKPSGAPDPVIANPNQFNTNVMGMSKLGIYKFLWTVTTGNCTSSDEMEINVSQNNEICTAPVNGNTFQWNLPSGTPSPVTKKITQPASNYGFAFDIYRLDNSFNLNINGTLIATQELQFQSNGTSGINVEFADGDQYETNTTHNGNQADIWEMRGNAANPLIRVQISPTGVISLFGSKTSYGPLFPLVLKAGNTLNTITWNHASTNNITVTQNVEGVTLMEGYGYGLNIIPCFCYKPGLTTGGSILPTNVGITSLSRAGSGDTDNWPMVRKGGWIALESQTKGFVPNRVAFIGGNPVGIAPANFVEGMMVYDITNKCMKLYTLKDGDTAMAWHCITTQTCNNTESFTLDCINASISGDTHLDPNVNFTITIPYLEGDGSSYAQQLIPSTGTTGLTATLSAGTLSNSSGNLVLTVSGPSTSGDGGTYYFEVSINGKVCNVAVTVTAEASET